MACTEDKLYKLELEVKALTWCGRLDDGKCGVTVRARVLDNAEQTVCEIPAASQSCKADGTITVNVCKTFTFTMPASCPKPARLAVRFCRATTNGEELASGQLFVMPSVLPCSRSIAAGDEQTVPMTECRNGRTVALLMVRARAWNDGPVEPKPPCYPPEPKPPCCSPEPKPTCCPPKPPCCPQKPKPSCCPPEPKPSCCPSKPPCCPQEPKPSCCPPEPKPTCCPPKPTCCPPKPSCCPQKPKPSCCPPEPKPSCCPSKPPCCPQEPKPSCCPPETKPTCCPLKPTCCPPNPPCCPQEPKPSCCSPEPKPTCCRPKPPCCPQEPKPSCCRRTRRRSCSCRRTIVVQPYIYDILHNVISSF